MLHTLNKQYNDNLIELPVIRRLERKNSSFQHLINTQIISSILLLITTIATLAWASIDSLNHWYEVFVNTQVGLTIGSAIFAMPLNIFVNDFLLTIFFFMIGLEIKKEFLVGELSNVKSAATIFIAALGGMVVPALIFLLFNFHHPQFIGWGIPMATDTAFALGILALFRNKLPKSIFIFVAALAIVDDIGAILVIAFYYTAQLHILSIIIGFLILGVLATLGYLGVRHFSPYFLLGLCVWVLFESAGLHGTVAGILVAFCIPATSKKNSQHAAHKLFFLVNKFKLLHRSNAKSTLHNQQQHDILEHIGSTVQHSTTPLQRWKNSLEIPVLLLVLPLFALTNAGVDVSWMAVHSAFNDPVSIGIFTGLFLGKPIGITLFTYLSQRLHIGKLPGNCTMREIVPVSLFTGIGFTMSLFIATRSFINNDVLLNNAKVGIILGSLFAIIAGMIILYCYKKPI